MERLHDSQHSNVMEPPSKCLYFSVFRMNIPRFLEDIELLVRTYEKDLFDKKIGELCMGSTENDLWLECNCF